MYRDNSAQFWNASYVYLLFYVLFLLYPLMNICMIAIHNYIGGGRGIDFMALYYSHLLPLEDP